MGKHFQIRDTRTNEVWIGVMMARSCPSEPYGGEVGGLTAKMDWTSHLKVSSNKTLITDLGMLPMNGVRLYQEWKPLVRILPSNITWIAKPDPERTLILQGSCVKFFLEK